MIDAAVLLADGRRVVTGLVEDIRTRAADMPAIDEALTREYTGAIGAGRTGQSFEDWRRERITQSAVAWVLATVFTRFCEDNGLVEEARIAGHGNRLSHARDRQTLYFRNYPEHSDREYLLSIFEDLAGLPGMGQLLDPAHNPLWALPVSADGATALLDLVRREDPETGHLIHDFTDPAWRTRFLGDLYQDLSEDARKRYALLQTPDFIEAFLLDRTLEPAIDAFGLGGTTVIDPTCGSGHMLLGAFSRLLGHWRKREPGAPERVLVQRALDALAGVDVNPFAIAIARFRLMVAVLRASHIARLADAPDFRMKLAVGDSLLHGRAPNRLPLTGAAVVHKSAARHYYSTEDADALAQILGDRYAVVIGNPPYVTVKDPALNQAYRDRFPNSCRGKYSLGAPFTEYFLDLAHHHTPSQLAGFVGTITANSFMKREMGKNLIERVLPEWDLTHVIDTSGAYIPGHGTPTVMLLARGRAPASDTIRTVMGIRGEPTRPENPPKGRVWSAILAQVDDPGSESEFVSVLDMERSQFATHPWSIGGGGAAELKQRLDETGKALASVIDIIGVIGISGADEVMLGSANSFQRFQVEDDVVRPLVEGEAVRDFALRGVRCTYFPYERSELVPLESRVGAFKRLWPYRVDLANRTTFSRRTYSEEGRPWWEWHQVSLDRLRNPLSIAFANVATHNHFVFDRGGKVFNRTAPVIKLPAKAGEDAHLGLLGVLNSSTACFWMQQTLYSKGNGGYGGGIASEGWERFYAFDGTKLKQFPLPAGRPLEWARRLDRCARELAACEPEAICEREVPTRVALDDARGRWETIRAEMIAVQEELDWEVLALYGLCDNSLVAAPNDLPPLRLGERAFEILLARQVAAGEIETAWYARFRSTPVTASPDQWPPAYRRVVEARMASIESERDIALIERCEYKRRWATEPWEMREQEALRDWLLDRMERPELWAGEPRLRSTGQLADALLADADFAAVAAVYARRPDPDLTRIVTELASEEAVPALDALRYSDTGMRKRAVWKHTWELQRAEDRGERVGTIAVPPKYAQADFARSTYWSLRGKLDVPKERFVSYPHAGRDTDATPVLGWAGWDYRQQALALATWLVERRDADGWDAKRLTPLLAGLAELLPWVRQWHDEPDPAVGQSMGDYLTGFLDQTLLEQGLTALDLHSWRPPGAVRGRRRKQT
jgi:hypothetical protein